MYEYLILSDVHARKYSKTDVHTRSILEKFAFDKTLMWDLSSTDTFKSIHTRVAFLKEKKFSLQGVNCCRIRDIEQKSQ